jgi:hypothetical protein
MYPGGTKKNYKHSKDSASGTYREDNNSASLSGRIENLSLNQQPDQQAPQQQQQPQSNQPIELNADDYTQVRLAIRILCKQYQLQQQQSTNSGDALNYNSVQNLVANRELMSRQDKEMYQKTTLMAQVIQYRSTTVCQRCQSLLPRTHIVLRLWHVHCTVLE